MNPQRSQQIASQNFDTFFNQLRILHLAFLFGVISILGLLYFLKRSEPLEFRLDTIGMAYLAFVCFCLFLGARLSMNKINNVKREDTLLHKLEVYRASKILLYALNELPILLGAIAFFTLNNLLFLCTAFLCTIYFASLKPHREKIKQNIAVTAEEAPFFEGKYTVAEIAKRIKPN